MVIIMITHCLLPVLVTLQITPASSRLCMQFVLGGCGHSKILDSFPEQLTSSRKYTPFSLVPNSDLLVATPPLI